MTLDPLYLTAVTLVSAAGRGIEATYGALVERRTGLRPCDFANAELDTFIGRVDGLEDAPVIDELREYDCRNNRLAQIGLRQDGFEDAVAEARRQYGAHRLGVFIGTSTSGMEETESAYRNRDPDTGVLPAGFDYRHTGSIFSAADFVQAYLRLEGPVASLSTACSSSAKVFATAHRFIQAGLCDAAVVGGVDSLCLTTLYGFTSLELVSSRPCRPGDRDRDGLSIGEAAGFALLERAPAKAEQPKLALKGFGESSDGHHMSSPHPEGLGARLAMERALASAGLSAADVDYINLHGTATPANDLTEDLAVRSVFGTEIACSSTKGWTGHALGAAGIAEAVICAISIQRGLVPGSLNTRELDPALQCRVLLENERRSVRCAMSNSFGFGGSNCSIILGASD